ncbi:rod shape-determining protein RodA [Sporolactobacillus sp. THM7-4]|nr:rod shape-determining protein RodA [Sporolactobacillus sp. THM7-4]
MNRETFSKIDYTLIFIVFLFACISFISIYNAPLDQGGRATSFAYKQIGWYVFSMIVAFLITIVDYERLKRLHWIFYGFGIIMLLGLTFAKLGLPVPLAAYVNGAWSWYNVPAAGRLQPSEFMKLFLIISLSVEIDKHNETYSIRSSHEDWLLLGKIALISLPPFALVFLQPDLGSALVMISIVVSLILVSGINLKFITGMFALIGSGIVFFFISWFKFPAIINLILASHQKDRFLAWLDPYKYQNDYGFQVLSALNSIGSGQFFNQKIDPSITIPESYNDFIFAVIGGSFGFVGAGLVILLFFIMIYRIIRTAMETHDPFGSYICTGIIGMLMFQVFENVGMTVLVMPVTGITLPFLSYGGSSLLSSLICVGLVMSVQMRTQKYMFT